MGQAITPPTGLYHFIHRLPHALFDETHWHLPFSVMSARVAVDANCASTAVI